MRLGILFIALWALAFAALACGDDSGNGAPTAGPTPVSTAAASQPTQSATTGFPQGGEPVALDSANFVDGVDNPYWPMTAGNRWVYEETDEEGNVVEVEVTVTSDTKIIAGITATVVRDTVTQDGEVIEDTFDWYAQDTDGNVWYMGEDTKEYKDGAVVSTKGSWEHGVGGAQAGIIMPANPQVGMTYRQEYYEGEAEDHGEVLSLSEHVDVPFGSFDRVVQIADTTPLEPDVLEHKHYARNVGLVLTIDVKGGGREELIRFEPAGRASSAVPTTGPPSS